MTELTITAKRDGFRRCGVVHSDTPVVWPAGSFTEEQIAILKSEPQLVVHEGSAVSDDVQSEVLHARSRIIELEETVNQLRGGQSELEKAQARITELVGSNAELQEKLAAASQTISDLTAERDRLRAEVTAKAPGGDASADNEEPSSKAKK
ncbi:HI1506-related protein [Phytobacter diazotrophicus]